MNAVSAGAAVARARVGTGFVTAACGVASAAVFVVASLERGASSAGAADRTLLGVVAGWALPLFAYVVVSRAVRRGRLADAVSGVARFGADARGATLGLVAAVAFRVALASAGITVLGALSAHAPPSAGLIADLLNGAWIGALGGAAYTAWFFLGASFGRAGGGRAAFLAVDWFAGAGHGALSAAWPRAHLRSLLGGDLVQGLSGWQSTMSLYFLVALYLTLGLVRVPR